MADLDQLKQKYSPVIQTIEGFGDLGAKVDSVSLDGEKLYLKGSVPSEVVANRVWDVIKQVDPVYSDLHHEIATTGGPNQSYSVKSGDNLSGLPTTIPTLPLRATSPIRIRSRSDSKLQYLCSPKHNSVPVVRRSPGAAHGRHNDSHLLTGLAGMKGKGDLVVGRSPEGGVQVVHVYRVAKLLDNRVFRELRLLRSQGPRTAC